MGSFGVTRPRRRSLLWWTLALATTFYRCELPASTSHGEHRAPPLSRVTRSTPVRRCRTVRLRSLVSPSGRFGPDVPARPSSLRRSVTTLDRPPPGIASHWQRVSSGFGVQDKTSPHPRPRLSCTRRHRHAQIDQSILKKVNTYQKPLRKWQVSGRANAPPAHYHPATAGRSLVGQNR